jgi:hypothetical protein
MKKIRDEYTDIQMTPQRRWQLRNPDKEAERRKRWRSSEAGKAAIREVNRKQYEKRKAELQDKVAK